MANRKKTTGLTLANSLKKSLLQSAIMGKLVPQNSDDGNAQDLLTQIQTEKQTLIQNGKLKKEKPLAPITDDEKPFEIPDNWVWVRLGDLTFNWGQKNPDKEFTYIDISSIDNKNNKLGNLDNIIQPQNAPSRARKIVKKGDIIYSTVRPYLMNICMIDKEISPEPIVSTGFAVLNTSIKETNEYLFKVLLSPYFSSCASSNENSKGVAYPAINDEKLKNIIIPLPPLAEQARIVAKLDEILPKIDTLAITETTLNALNAKFPKQMQSALLQSAIMGKLVPQNSDDGNAQDLLTQIQTEKQTLIQNGKLKKEKPLAPITDDEKPFEIPDNWVWVRLGDLTFNWGQKNPDKEFTYIDISSIDNKNNKLGNLDNIIQPQNAPSRARKIVKKGDIIYSTVRPYLMNICMIDKEISPEPIVSTGFAVLNTSIKETNEYLFKVLLSPYFSSCASSNENSKGVAYPAINDEKLKNIIIPLPPLAEQARIVAKLDEVLPKVHALNEWLA